MRKKKSCYVSEILALHMVLIYSMSSVYECRLLPRHCAATHSTGRPTLRLTTFFAYKIVAAGTHACVCAIVRDMIIIYCMCPLASCDLSS